MADPDEREKRNARNETLITEFRAKEGRLGGHFEGGHILLVTTTGAKTGRKYVNPMRYLPDGDRAVVVASYGGAPDHPDWYKNMVANPQVTVEVPGETFEAVARTITGPEREPLLERATELFPAYAEYQTRTDRILPVVALERLG